MGLHLYGAGGQLSEGRPFYLGVGLDFLRSFMKGNGLVMVQVVWKLLMSLCKDCMQSQGVCKWKQHPALLEHFIHHIMSLIILIRQCHKRCVIFRKQLLVLKCSLGMLV